MCGAVGVKGKKRSHLFEVTSLLKQVPSKLANDAGARLEGGQVRVREPSRKVREEIIFEVLRGGLDVSRSTLNVMSRHDECLFGPHLLLLRRKAVKEIYWLRRTLRGPPVDRAPHNNKRHLVRGEELRQRYSRLSPQPLGGQSVALLDPGDHHAAELRRRLPNLGEVAFAAVPRIGVGAGQALQQLKLHASAAKKGPVETGRVCFMCRGEDPEGSCCCD